MAVLAAGRNAIFLVAVFAQLVSGVLELRSLGAVVAGSTCASFDAVVVALGAVTDPLLVRFVREGDLAHFGGQFDDFRAIVGRSKGGGTEGDQADSYHDGKNAFHNDSPPNKSG